MNLRFPNIQGDTRAQLEAIKSYLYQLTQELNYGLQAAPSVQTTQTAPTKKPQEQFNDIKALIIKSADIVNAYSEAISQRLEGVYVAQSDFGTYAEETAAQLSANAQAIEQKYENVQQLFTQLEQSMVEVNAHINTGLLYYAEDGTPVYGMEIGQRTWKDGEEIFYKFARFTADKLAFYDQAGTEAAYISDGHLRIPNALVELSLTRGGYTEQIGADGSTVERWVGV